MDWLRTQIIMIFCIMMIFILAVLTSSCSDRIIYVNPDRFVFQKTVEPKERTIRIHNSDVELYELYIDNLRGQIEFHNNQIDSYNKATETDQVGDQSE